jgi:hypothetical protein
MLNVECHCGNLKLLANALPASLTSCNCSICYRLGALWAYFDLQDVEISRGDKPTMSYSWGEKTITYHRCGECGCTTHYTASEADGSELIALNCRMAPTSQIHALTVREFDGLVSWKYRDEETR